MKFDADNSEHINLMNVLYNACSPYFRGRHVYVTDVLRDVEALMDMDADGAQYIVVGDTSTMLLQTEREAHGVLHSCEGMRGIVKVTRETSDYGTVRWHAERADSIWRAHTCGFMPLSLVLDEEGVALWDEEGEAVTLCNWIDALEHHLHGRA